MAPVQKRGNDKYNSETHAAIREFDLPTPSTHEGEKYNEHLCLAISL